MNTLFNIDAGWEQDFVNYDDNSLTDSDAGQEGGGISIIFGTLNFENKDR